MSRLWCDLLGWVVESDGVARRLLDDPFLVSRGLWEFGEEVALPSLPLCPVQPRTVVGIGRSYRAHAEELGNAVPEQPLLFLKAATALWGPDEVLRWSAAVGRVDFEGEIALVVGKRCEDLATENALDAILGVTAACDTTAREIQQGDRTFARGKSLRRASPVGPCVDLDPSWGRLEVVTRVDGIERQRGGEELLLWPLAEMVSYVSRWITLEPGDLILTGTPAGVGPLAAGMRLEVEVSGLPPLRATVDVS